MIKLARTDDEPGVIVKANLGETDYARACDAHKNGQKVAITGKLYKDATMKQPQLKEYLRFEVLSPDLPAPQPAPQIK